MIAFLLNPGGRRRRRRRNAWRGHKRAHRLAALRGWSKRRRKGGGRRRRTRSRRRGRRCKTARYMIAGKVRTRCRRRRHKAKGSPWNYETLPTSSGGWSYPGGQVAANRRRRRRNGRRARRRNTTWFPQMAMNPSWVPAYAMNPGLKSVPGTLRRNVLPGVIGLFGSMTTTAMLAKVPYVGQYFGGSGIVGALTSVGSAALTAALIGIISPAWVAPAFIGGLMGVGLTVAKEYIMPTVSRLKSGIGDYLTVSDAQNARPLGCYGCGTGMGDMGLHDATWNANNWQINDTPDDLASMNPFTLGTEFTQPITPEQMTAQLPYNAGLGDYLTVQNARDARPLGGMGRTMNDAAIEGVATMELGS